MTTQKQPSTKVESHMQQPPAAPVGKPFDIGPTNALVTPVKTGQRETITLRLKRHIKASPEKIYKAFTDPDAYAAWLPPHGFVGKVHSMEPRVGGKFRMSFYTATKSWSNTFGGTYVELVPYSKIVHTDSFETDDPSLQGEMRVTITLTPKDGGTLVEVVQEGIPASPAVSGAPFGWAQSFEKLAQLVEPELPF